MNTPQVTYRFKTITSTHDIVDVANDAGSNMFSPETMRYWRSRVLSHMRAIDGHECKPGHRYAFITSEPDYDGIRRYSHRVMTLDYETVTTSDDYTYTRPRVQFDTVGERHDTISAAISAMKAQEWDELA